MVKTSCQTVEQPDSLNLIVPPATRRVEAPSAGGGDQAEVRQPAAPSAGTTVSADQPGSSVALPA